MEARKKAAFGKYECWLVGPSQWEVRRDGVVLETAQHMSGCASAAQRLYNIDKYYTDRNASGQSPLNAHR